MNAIQTDYSGVPCVEVQTSIGKIRISDKDLANPGDYDGYNKLFAIGHEFGTLAVVFARCEQYAIDEAVNSGKMDSEQVSAEDLAEMSEEEIGELLCAGNASEYFRQDYLWCVEVPMPAFSLVALLAYQQENQREEVPA